MIYLQCDPSTLRPTTCLSNYICPHPTKVIFHSHLRPCPSSPSSSRSRPVPARSSTSTRAHPEGRPRARSAPRGWWSRRSRRRQSEGTWGQRRRGRAGRHSRGPRQDSRSPRWTSGVVSKKSSEESGQDENKGDCRSASLHEK